MDKYIGKIVEIIYLDRNQKITQRQIRVNEISDGIVKAYCMFSKSARTFKLENVLAMNPVVNRHAV